MSGAWTWVIVVSAAETKSPQEHSERFSPGCQMIVSGG